MQFLKTGAKIISFSAESYRKPNGEQQLQMEDVSLSKSIACQIWPHKWKFA